MFQELAKKLVMDYFNDHVDAKEVYLDAYKKWENVRVGVVDADDVRAVE